MKEGSIEYLMACLLKVKEDLRHLKYKSVISISLHNQKPHDKPVSCVEKEQTNS